MCTWACNKVIQTYIISAFTPPFSVFTLRFHKSQTLKDKKGKMVRSVERWIENPKNNGTRRWIVPSRPGGLSDNMWPCPGSMGCMAHDFIL